MTKTIEGNIFKGIKYWMNAKATRRKEETIIR